MVFVVTKPLPPEPLNVTEPVKIEDVCENKEEMFLVFNDKVDTVEACKKLVDTNLV